MAEGCFDSFVSFLHQTLKDRALWTRVEVF